MGERGEESIQSNLESFMNLEKLSKKIRGGDILQTTADPRLRMSQGSQSLRKNYFQSTGFVKAKLSESQDLSISDFNFPGKTDDFQMNIEKEEKKFEEELNRERLRRQNPLELLKKFILRTKALCERLQQVR